MRITRRPPSNVLRHLNCRRVSQSHNENTSVDEVSADRPSLSSHGPAKVVNTAGKLDAPIQRRRKNKARFPEDVVHRSFRWHRYVISSCTRKSRERLASSPLPAESSPGNCRSCPLEKEGRSISVQPPHKGPVHPRLRCQGVDQKRCRHRVNGGERFT